MTRIGANGEASKLVKLFLGFSMASWVSALISFALTPVITRLIEPDSLGSIDLFVSFCVMFEYASTLGMHQSLLRFYNEPPQGSDGDELLRFSIRVSFFGAVIAGLFIFIFADYFSVSILGSFSFAIPALMTVFILSNGFIDVLKTRPRLLGQTMRYTAMVVSLSVGTKLAYLSYGFTESVLLTITAIALVDALVMLFYFWLERKSLIGGSSGINRQAKLDIFKYALPTVPVMFMSNVNTSLPKIVLNGCVDSYSVGIYAATATLVGLVHLVQVGINLFWSPFVFANYKSKQRVIQNVHTVVCLCMALIGLLLILFQDPLYLLLGSSYREGATILALLAASPVFYTMGETVGIGINIEKKTYLNIVIIGSALAVNLVLCALLIPIFGLVGAAASVMISSATMLLLKALIGERYYRIIVSPIKTLSAPLIYSIAAILTSLCSPLLGPRICITLVAIVVLILIYRREAIAIICFGQKTNRT